VQLTGVRVPGKVMLSGEYAVMLGGMAFMMPISRHIEVDEIDLVPDKPYSPVVQMAIKYPIPEVAKFEQKHGRSHIKINPGGFLTTTADGYPVKLGLGLSAAEAVAVVALRFERAGKPWQQHRKLVFKYALEIHREIQKGLGSGADVAACAFGAPLVYYLKRNRPQIDLVKSPKHDNCPPMVLVWTGRPANTREMIEKFMAWAKEDKVATKRLLPNLVKASDILARSWLVASPINLYNAIDIFGLAMQECAEAAGIKYRLELHHELESWARKKGGRAKPTGAGGGDMILLVGDLPFGELEYTKVPLVIPSRS